MSLFAAAITLADNSGAFVVFEKIPQKTTRTVDAWHDGIRDTEPVYECSFRLVGAEHLSGPLPNMIAHICDRLKAEPLVDDTSTRIDLGSLGRPALELFRNRGVHPWRVLIEGEKETKDARGNTVLPVNALRSMATLMLETNRVEIAAGLVEGPSILLALGKVDELPERGPARDLGIAAALALHTAATTGGGAWPSSKPKPREMLEDEEKRAWQRNMRHEAIKRARGARGEW